MKRSSSILILLIVFALAGKTAVTSFFPDVLTISVSAGDWAEETAEEDEYGQDDKVMHLKSTMSPLPAAADIPGTPYCCTLLMATREIVAPPPQA